MHDADTLFWDLDGTLTDPYEGITRSVAYALHFFDIEVPDRTVLCPFIGPPLKDSFMRFYGFSSADAELAIARYRGLFCRQRPVRKYGLSRYPLPARRAGERRQTPCPGHYPTGRLRRAHPHPFRAAALFFGRGGQRSGWKTGKKKTCFGTPWNSQMPNRHAP